MHEQYFEKKINNKVIIYDKRIDIIKFSYNEKIADNYSKERLTQVTPYKTDIVVTKKCNQNCVNCFADSTPSGSVLEMRYRDILQKIEERHNQIIRLVITGGEPFLHSNINQILGLPHLFQDLKFVICSNGTNIHQSHINLLNRLDWLIILSIHGGMETHNNYTRSSFYSSVIDSLGRLSSAVRIKLYSVINEYSTERDIDHLFELKEKYNVGAIKFMTPRDSRRFDGKQNKNIVEYVKTRLDKESGLQETSAETELITVGGDVTVTD